MPVETAFFNRDVLSRFKKLIQHKRLAHAYLFSGPLNVGKHETALAIAKLINCEQPSSSDGVFFCDQCAACNKINNGNHPDIRIFDQGETDSIKIDQVRGILSQIQLRPYEAQKKIFIIKNIESLTTEAGNALLKTLEEPSSSSLLILTTSVLEKNLETIISRCHVIPFYPASYEIIEAQLKEQCKAERKEAYFLSRFAEGALGRAKSLQKKKIFEKKNQWLDEFVFSPAVDDFVKKIIDDKEENKDFLNVLLSWFHDALLIKAGAEETRAVHLDRLHELSHFSEAHSFEQLQDLYAEAVKTSRLLDENLNVRIPLLIIKEKVKR